MKKSIFLLICLLFMFSSIGFAVDNGEILTGADEGWKRFDDNNPNVIYSNYTAQALPDTIAYKGIHHYSNLGDATITFRFTGSKLRLNASLTQNATKYIITIDGESTVITPNPTGYTFLLNSFVKTNLSEGAHTVIIESTCIGDQITLDSLDIATNGDLIGLNQPYNLKATPESTSVKLSWDAVNNASSYIIKRSTSSNGPFINYGTATANIFTDNNVQSGASYYYVVSAVISNTESEPSNVANATMPDISISSNSAILEITLKSGIIKEFNLNSEEIVKYLDWFDSISSGVGKTYHVLPVNSKIKPFINRKEYIIFDKIQSFRVSEYAE